MKYFNTFVSLYLFALVIGFNPCFAGVPEVGQVLMVGFNEQKVTPELIGHLKKIKPGAIILFRRNVQSPQQLNQLVQDLSRALNPHLPSPLLFAIDQEGGSVYRIPTVPKIPSPAAIGKSNDPQMVERYGYAIGQLLKGNGISMNLAPVLDVEIGQGTQGYIGSRSFGVDPALVAQMGYLFSKGLAAAGVIPTGKHFPGLGGVFTDPHETTPMSGLEWHKDWNRELLPFRQFSRLMPSALMLSHVIYPNLDSQRRPASVSPYIIKRILRDSLKYQGLVVTDDLLMKGITSQFSPKEAAIEALNSGADLVMLSWSRTDQQRVHEFLQESLTKGSLKTEELKEKIQRIHDIKRLIGLPPQIQEARVTWVSPQIRELNKNLLEKNLAQDASLYRRLGDTSKLYLLNLTESWVSALRRKFPGVKASVLSEIGSFQKLSEAEKNKSVLFVGVRSRAAKKTLAAMSSQEKARSILVVIGDFEIGDRKQYYSVFAPLWPFEGMAESVLRYL